MKDEEVEKIVLYFIIFEKEPLLIEEKDFTTTRNKLIANAIIQLRKEKQDVSMIKVKEKIKRNQQQVLEYLTTLGENILGVTAEFAYEQLKNLTRKREIFAFAKNILANIENKDDANIYVQDCIKELNKISSDDNIENDNLMNQVVETVNEIQNNWQNRGDRSLYTGIYDLDDLTGGLHNKELTIIGARPRSWKNNIIFTNWRKNSRK